MLNKPKFMSPSVNMYGNTVIDVNSKTLPFSCVIDGNEVITDFQIVISRLKDDVKVYDTGMVKLETPFFPVNNRNQNVVFSRDIKEYADQQYVLNTDSNYVSGRTYYELVDGNYVVYARAETDWGSKKYTLYRKVFMGYLCNSADAYYWTITFKNSTSGTKTTSAPEVFYANSIPETVVYYSYNDKFSDLSENSRKAEETYDSTKSYFKIGNDGMYIKYDYIDEATWETDRYTLYYLNFSELQKRKVYFKSTYNQNENIPLKRYGWRITDATSGTVIMDTISQNQIYGVADDISCVCSGLVNQTSYLLELYVETQNGYFITLPPIPFDVNYVVKTLEGTFEVEALDNTAGIMLNWGNLRTAEGVVVGNEVTYEENFPVKSSSSIEIPEDTKVVFADTSNKKGLGIDEESYVVLSFQLDKTQDTVLFEMTGLDKYTNSITRKLEYIASSKTLKYTITKGSVIAIKEYTVSGEIGELCWYVVTMYPLINNMADCKIVESVALGGEFPSEDLYPTDSSEDEVLYPYFGKWDKLRNEVD